MHASTSPDPDLARRNRRRFVAAGLAALIAAAPLLVVFSVGLLGVRVVKAGAMEFWPLAAIGFLAMFGFLLLSAPLLANRCERSPSVLAPHHWLMFAVGAAAASLANWLLHGAVDWTDRFGLPLYWLLLLGSAPALCNGGLAVLAYLWLERRAKRVSA
ncbi:MAG TPA: hypothetical protein VFZ65_02525 [Planctomycetota bacterium]|nr:hypothetical protein [Planctomycetota bacterium]